MLVQRIPSGMYDVQGLPTEQADLSKGAYWVQGRGRKVPGHSKWPDTWDSSNSKLMLSILISYLRSQVSWLVLVCYLNLFTIRGLEARAPVRDMLLFYIDD